MHKYICNTFVLLLLFLKVLSAQSIGKIEKEVWITPLCNVSEERSKIYQDALLELSKCYVQNKIKFKEPNTTNYCSNAAEFRANKAPSTIFIGAAEIKGQINITITTKEGIEKEGISFNIKKETNIGFKIIEFVLDYLSVEKGKLITAKQMAIYLM